MEKDFSIDSKSGSYADGSLNKEINPRFGGNQANSFSHSQFLAPRFKIFTCKYCERKFLNSRALGGHQNAHKKERTLWMMDLHSHNNKSLGVEPHGFVHKPIQEESRTGKPKESFNGFREPGSVEAADQDLMSWPGSFRMHSTDSHGSKTEPIETGNSSNGEPLKMELVLNKIKPDQSKTCRLDLDLHL